jgi:hypothetical protein
LAQHHAAVAAEIRSPDTEGDDKFHQYQQLPSRVECVLLAMQEPRADLFGRGPEGLLILHQVGPANELVVESLGFRAPMERLYCDIDLGQGG